MVQGRSIRLFLVDGTPSGLLTAEIMNWTGHVLTGPRSRLAELVQRQECTRTGIYFLFGTVSDDGLRIPTYIGESDNVAERLRQHNRPQEQGGKDFWEQVCLVTSKDLNLTKAHVKYLESRLVAIAKEAGRSLLVNSTLPEYKSLPESDLSDMDYFLEQIRTIMPVLGFDFLRATVQASSEPLENPQQSNRSPRFVMELPKQGIQATAQEIDGEFFVFKGSLARSDWVGKSIEKQSSYQPLFNLLLADGILQAGPQGLKVFSRDYVFSSPSAAAAVISGRSANGRVSWLVEGSNNGRMTYADWQEQQVDMAVAQSGVRKE